MMFKEKKIYNKAIQTAKRKGLGRGLGKGYKNIIPKDPKVHSDSAKGRKQPQKVNIIDMSYNDFAKRGIYLPKMDDTDKDGVVNVKDCRPLNPQKQDLKETAKKIGGAIREKAKKLGLKAEKEARKYAKVGFEKAKELTKKEIEELKKKIKERKEKQLAEIKHPLIKKLERQKNRVEELRKQYEAEDDTSELEKLKKELNKEEEELRDIQDKITNLDVQDLSNKQLEELAVRWKDTSLLGFGSNIYERELLRRLEAKARLDVEKQRLKKRLKEEKERLLKEDGGFFGF